MAIDHGSRHRTPFPARLLYEFSLNPMFNSKVEEYRKTDDDWTIRLANWQTNMNILVKYKPSDFP